MTKMPRLGLPWWAVHAARNLGHRAERALAPAEAVKAWRDASDAKEALGKHVSEGLITVDQYHADFVCCQERLLDAERALRAAHAAYEKGEA
jgi:hypothetical protein